MNIPYFPTRAVSGSTRGFATQDPERQGIIVGMQAPRLATGGTPAARNYSLLEPARAADQLARRLVGPR